MYLNQVYVLLILAPATETGMKTVITKLLMIVIDYSYIWCFPTCFGVLQRVAACYSVSQRVAACCNGQSVHSTSWI